MKRGTSGLSFVVGIDKPSGMTSHDVVSRCRRIFGEGRIGHTGTLDPMASGAMAVCVGPATKLSAYVTFHDKDYVARFVFGTGTDTDDAEGEVIETAAVPDELADADFAMRTLEGMCGVQDQMPPRYSAKKVAGVRSYKAARAGENVALEAQRIEVYSALLLSIGRMDDGALYWDVRVSVSAGTYIRAIARDLGHQLSTCAHLGSLRRMRSGRLSVGRCVTLDELERHPDAGRIDPLWLLGVRFLAIDDGRRRKLLDNGAPMDVEGLPLYEASAIQEGTSGAVLSHEPLSEGEIVGMREGNVLRALYEYESRTGLLKARCVFAQGVDCGTVSG